MAEPETGGDPDAQLTPDPGDTAPPPPRASDVAEERSLFDDVRDIVDDGRTLIEAELAYQSARVAYGWERGAGITVLLLISLAATLFALIAVVVGLLLALAPLITIWGALGVVGAALLLTAVITFRMAIGRFRALRAKLISGPQLPPAPERVVK